MDGWKLNIDGYAKGDPGLAAADGLIRNEQENWVPGFIYNMGVAFSVIVEVAAMWLGMKKLVQMQATNMKIETDSLMLVHMLRNNISNNSPWRAWIEDCQSILQQHPSFQVNHIYREENKCADLLANFGLDQPIGEHYLDQLPVFLRTQFEKDKRGDMTLKVTNGL